MRFRKINEEQKKEILEEPCQEERPPDENKKKAKDVVIRSELNLEQNFVFTVSTYSGKSREVIVKDEEKKIERRVIIGKTIDGIETGVLTANHFKLYLALLDLWEKAGRPVNGSVHFAILKILKRLGLVNSGTNYERIKHWLIHLSQIPLTFIDSFYSSDGEGFSSLKPFQILSYLDIYERKYNTKGKGQIIRGYGEFRFHDNILVSLVNNYSHPLRLDIITGFKRHRDIAILLYTYLDRQLAFKEKYEIGLEKLFDYLDLSQKQIRYPADRKQKLEPVLGEICGKELSTGILSKIEVVKTADGKGYKLVCHKKPFSKKLKDKTLYTQLQFPMLGECSVEREESGQDTSELLSQLVGLGLTEKQAGRLVLEVDSEVINAQIEYLPFRVRGYQAQGKQINESAILYDSINDNWGIPKGYFEVEKQQEHEAKKLEEQRLAQLEQEERDKAEQEKQEIDAYKATLESEVRARLRERALENINSTEGIRKEFITDTLIEIYENEILKLEMK
ncbi:hypothetical protein FJY90_00660 [Candidatus Gottesmanbacteria bacterium]|nr:hypothetical protein [Candidatus Gottesmanbacteria bacterium]